ncbi:hypothetical protein ACTMU2_33795 [Cupriavidus basilensis]
MSQPSLPAFPEVAVDAVLIGQVRPFGPERLLLLPWHRQTANDGPVPVTARSGWPAMAKAIQSTTAVREKGAASLRL